MSEPKQFDSTGADFEPWWESAAESDYVERMSRLNRALNYCRRLPEMRAHIERHLTFLQQRLNRMRAGLR